MAYHVNQFNMALLILSKILHFEYFVRKSIFYYNIIRKISSIFNTFFQVYILVRTARVIFLKNYEMI